MNKLKTSLIENRSLESTRRLFTGMVTELDINAQSTLPSYETVSRNIRSWRAQSSGIPAIPKERRGFSLPEEFTKFDDGELFISYDSGIDDSNRILIMSSSTSLKALKESSHVAIDATFRICPDLWYEMVSIHSVTPYSSIPCIFALLPDKKQISYERLFWKLMELMPEFAPSSFLSDFEMALINGIKKVFPTATTSGCLFHLNQNCFKKISELGFRKQYNTNSDFQVLVKSFPALAFLPPHRVIPAFQKLALNAEVPKEFLAYFQSTYIGVTGRSHPSERTPKYPIEFWNVRSRVLQGLPKANNGCEGFHNALRSSITASHPNIWKLLKDLKAEMELTNTKILQKNLGYRVLPKKKYRVLAERVRQQVQAFEGHEDTTYVLANFARNL